MLQAQGTICYLYLAILFFLNAKCFPGIDVAAADYTSEGKVELKPEEITKVMVEEVEKIWDAKSPSEEDDHKTTRSKGSASAAVNDEKENVVLVGPNSRSKILWPSILWCFTSCYRVFCSIKV